MMSLRITAYQMARARLSTLAVAVGLGAVYASDPRAAVHEYVALPLMRKFFDPEDAHVAAIKIMKYPFLNPSLPKNWLKNLDPENNLAVTLFQNSENPRVQPITLSSPVGVAAGVDKNGDAIDSLFGYGFSWVEVGSVTPLPQEGNPKPRVFRLPEDKAIINRYGFNSDGHAKVLARLLLREQRTEISQPGQVLALNLGKNKTGDEVKDYVKGVRSFGRHADVLVVNVSSPNTPGLRDLQSDEKLFALLSTLVKERDNLKGASLPPLVVKIAPDLEELQVKAMARAIVNSKVDGIIIGNTTVSRPETLLSSREVTQQVGGLSGPPVKDLELKVLKTLREEVGPNMTIIGCGGIYNGKDALESAHAGADFVQINSGFVWRGPGTAAHVIEDIKEGLGNKSWSSTGK